MITKVEVSQKNDAGILFICTNFCLWASLRVRFRVRDEPLDNWTLRLLNSPTAGYELIRFKYF